MFSFGLLAGMQCEGVIGERELADDGSAVHSLSYARQSHPWSHGGPGRPRGHLERPDSALGGSGSVF